MAGEVIVSCVGDIALSDHPLLYGNGVRSYINHGIDIFQNIEPIFRESDLVIGNLECPLKSIDERGALESKTFCGDLEFAGLLKQAGFSVLNIANNHIMHHGEAAYNETILSLQNYGITPIGGGKQTDYVHHIFEKNEIKIALIGYSDVLERRSQKPLYFYDSQKDLFDLVKSLRKICDHVVLSIHWGVEDISRPHGDIIDFSRRLCDAGVSVILGHHPHVLQAVERYKSSLIFYSLGNFVFDCLWSDKYKTSIIANLLFKHDEVSYKVIPVEINKNYKVKLLNGVKKNKIIRHLDRISNKRYYDKTGRYWTTNESEIFDKEYKKQELVLKIKKILYLCARIYQMRRETIQYLMNKVFSLK